MICEYAPVDEIKTRSAVAFWQDQGFKFFTTIYKRDSLNKCKSDTPAGFIVVHLVTQEMHKRMETDTLADTHFYLDNDTKEIEWAKIYLRVEPYERVLEHEIGHALGFLHYNNEKHLMHERWISGGWDPAGLKR